MKHEFGPLVRIPDFTIAVQACSKCHVIRGRFSGCWNYYGKEHMGGGKHACPAFPSNGCSTAPDLVLCLAIVNAAIAGLMAQRGKGRS